MRLLRVFPGVVFRKEGKVSEGGVGDEFFSDLEDFGGESRENGPAFRGDRLERNGVLAAGFSPVFGVTCFLRRGGNGSSEKDALLGGFSAHVKKLHADRSSVLAECFCDESDLFGVFFWHQTQIAVLVLWNVLHIEPFQFSVQGGGGGCRLEMVLGGFCT